MENGSFPGQYNPVSNWDPRQLEIEYFWPLTEQISLDLDYTDCDKPRYTYSNVTSVDIGVNFAPTTVGTWVTSQLELNKDGITFNGFEKIGRAHV